MSVGALNGAMLAMGKYQRLFEVWNTISNDQVYTGGFNLLGVLRLLFGGQILLRQRSALAPAAG